MKNSRGSNCWLPRFFTVVLQVFHTGKNHRKTMGAGPVLKQIEVPSQGLIINRAQCLVSASRDTMLVTTNGMIIIQVGLKEDISTMSIIIYHIMIILYIMDYNYNCWNQQIPAIRFLSCQRWSQRGWARRITHKVWPWSKRLCRSNWKIQIDLNARHTALVQTKNPWSKIEDEVVRQSTKS